MHKCMKELIDWVVGCLVVRSMGYLVQACSSNVRQMEQVVVRYKRDIPLGGIVRERQRVAEKKESQMVRENKR